MPAGSLLNTRRAHRFAGTQLGQLLNGAGFLHQAHRAVDGCHALLKVLAHELPTTGAPALLGMIDDLVAKSASCRQAKHVFAQLDRLFILNQQRSSTLSLPPGR